MATDTKFPPTHCMFQDQEDGTRTLRWNFFPDDPAQELGVVFNWFPKGRYDNPDRSTPMSVILDIATLFNKEYPINREQTRALLETYTGRSGDTLGRWLICLRVLQSILFEQEGGTPQIHVVFVRSDDEEQES